MALVSAPWRPKATLSTIEVYIFKLAVGTPTLLGRARSVGIPHVRRAWGNKTSSHGKLRVNLAMPLTEDNEIGH